MSSASSTGKARARSLRRRWCGSSNSLARPKKQPEQLIEYGRVADPYGVRGWLRVVVDEPELLAAAPVWWIGGNALAVEESKKHSGTLLAKLDGVDSPEQAPRVQGQA